MANEITMEDVVELTQMSWHKLNMFVHLEYIYIVSSKSSEWMINGFIHTLNEWVPDVWDMV